MCSWCYKRFKDMNSQGSSWAFCGWIFPRLPLGHWCTEVAAILLDPKSNIQLMKHHPADILVPSSSVTAANTIHMMFSTQALVFLSQATGFIHTKLDQLHVLISFIHWVDRTVKRVTDGSAVAHKSGLVRYFPHAPGF